VTRHTGDNEDAIDALMGAVNEETVAVAEQAGEASAARSARRWLPFIMAGVLLVSLLMSSAVAIAVAQLYARQAQVDAAVSETRQLAENAKAAGDAANAELVRRGQTPVPIPQPGQAQDSEVLVAAAAARVLQSLPNMTPTAADLAAAVGAYVAANPVRVGPSPQQVADAVAAYFATTPPPSGPPGPTGIQGEPGTPGTQGERGERGPPPTAEEIRNALTEFLRDNPDVLCPRGGSFSQLTVRLADGGTADTWACVVQVAPPSTTQSSAVPLLPLGR
jgi:hypothetical protein